MERSFSVGPVTLCSPSYELHFTISVFSHFGKDQNYCPNSLQHLCIEQAPYVILCNLSLSSSDLFSVIFGLLALSAEKRNPAPPDFSKGSLEFIPFCLEALLEETHDMYEDEEEMDVFCISAYIYTYSGISCFTLITNEISRS